MVAIVGFSRLKRIGVVGARTSHRRLQRIEPPEAGRASPHFLRDSALVGRLPSRAGPRRGGAGARPRRDRPVPRPDAARGLELHWAANVDAADDLSHAVAARASGRCVAVQTVAGHAAVSGEPWVSGRPDRLRLGDVVRFDGDSHEIVGFDGAAAILSTPAGRTSVVTIAAPLGDASFEVLHLLGAPVGGTVKTRAVGHHDHRDPGRRLTRLMRPANARRNRCTAA